MYVNNEIPVTSIKAINIVGELENFNRYKEIFYCFVIKNVTDADANRAKRCESGS
jgi:hypothetical protein